MSGQHPWLIKSERHAQSCHERWSERRNRKPESPLYKDEWYAEQCGGCQYFIPLMGALAEDYGACSKPSSPFDGRVMFEHDGCDQYSEADEGWSPVEEAPLIP